MKKEKLKLNNVHKRDISKRVIVLILGVVLFSYLFKVFGSEIFNKFITNDIFINISNYIDTHIWLNIIAYGILGFIIIFFTICLTCNTLKLKWYEIIIIIAFSMLMSFFRYMWVGAITYLFDFLQYILIPVLYGKLTRRTSVLQNLMNALILYFAYNGIIMVNVTLCDLTGIMYGSNFIAYILSLIEPYLFIIAFTIFIIKGGYNNVESSINSEQKERTNDRIQKD